MDSAFRDPDFALSVLATIREPLLVLDDDLVVRTASPAYYEMFESDPARTEGRPLQEIGDGQWDIPALRRLLEDVIPEDRRVTDYEVDHDFPGIGRRTLLLNARTLRLEEDDETLILLAFEDVTERRTLEEELRRHARELESSNADLEQFAYAASHDLQEPLRMISSYLQLLERRYADELNEEAREFIDYAVDGAERMKALVNGLLQYSRVGRKEGEFGEVDLNTVLDEVLDDLSRRVEELDGEVTSGSLPVCYGNHEQLRRVLQNLVENALTYRGGRPPRIRVTGEGESDGAHLVVSDRGPGIPEEYRERIFQIFQQLDPHGEGREGTGIGLALCRKIVERHDGRIWVESAPGGGTEFHFTLNQRPGVRNR